jgi:hypothetical protein
MVRVFSASLHDPDRPALLSSFRRLEAKELAAAPAQWMPWNYRQALERGGLPLDCQ